MSSFLRLAALACAISAVTIPAHATMATPGSFAVSPSGAASYTIPIQAVPGTAGMEPKLAINYSSQAGNGLLGVGWSLSGLSAIGRCPQTKAQDGVRGGINYDANDRFCLDGQRLMATSGSYGANGTEYRSETEGYSKVVSYGTAGNGPAWFKVWTKSGLIMEYGNTADSRIEAQGRSTARIWALNRISDTKGNYMTVSYTEDNANGDFYPARIDYTGNANTGIAPNASVQFVYATRPDSIPMYQAGSMVKSTVRLDKVRAYQGTNLVKEYRLGYGQSSSTQRTRLNSVTECNATGSCLPSIQVTWSEQADGFVNNGTAITGAHGNWVDSPDRIRVMDVNGDGLQDILLGPDASGNWYVLQSTGTEFVGGGAWTSGYGNWSGASTRTRAMDVNGDGLQDIVMGPDANGNWFVLENTGTSFVNRGAWITGAYGNWVNSPDRIRVMDVNGDGLQDIVMGPDANGYWFILQSTGTSFVDKGALASKYGNWSGAPTRTRAMDVNGDGLQDIVMGPDANGNWFILENTGTSFVDKGAWTSIYGNWVNSPDRIRVMDVNGDGLQDIVMGPDANGYWLVLQSTGTSFVDKGAWITGAYGNWIDSPNRVQVMDVNGDGLQDIVLGPESSGNWYVLESIGTSFINRGVWLPSAYSNWGAASSRVRLMDVNGDGLQDIVLGPDAAGNWYHIGNNPIGDRVSKINNGLGADVSVSYKPLTDTSVYTKDASATYPKVDLQVPLYVVSSVSSSNGLGGVTTTSYTYGGLKAEADGRGMLGFRWMQSRQVETGITARTEFRQDWPYTGQPAKTTKTLPGSGNNGLLNQVVNTYDCKAYSGAAVLGNCSVAAGYRYFPYVKQSIEQSWDMNGAVFPSVTATSQYDEWGNATVVGVMNSDGYGKTTSNIYSNDVPNWYLGRLTKSSVASTSP